MMRWWYVPVLCLAPACATVPGTRAGSPTTTAPVAAGVSPEGYSEEFKPMKMPLTAPPAEAVAFVPGSIAPGFTEVPATTASAQSGGAKSNASRSRMANRLVARHAK